MRPQSRRRAGLSLLEVLVALALLSVIAVGLSGAFGLGLRVQDRSLAALDGGQELALRVRLREWVGAAVAPNALLPFPAEFEGDTEGVRFSTLALSHLYPDAATLRVAVSRADDGLRLTITALGDQGAELSRTEYPLAEGAGPMVFDYFDATATPPAWRDRWTDPTRLPKLIRITGAAPMIWPEFTVRPTLGLSARIPD